MANPLFNEQMNRGMMSQFQLFKKNPVQFLLQRQINIPPQFMNDPKGAVQYMLKNGIMSSEQLSNLQTMAQQFGANLN